MYRNMSFLMPQNYKYDCSVLWLLWCGLMWYRRLLFPKETALQCYTFILSLFSNMIYFHKLQDSGSTKGMHAEIIFLPPFVFFPQAARLRFLTRLSRGNLRTCAYSPNSGDRWSLHAALGALSPPFWSYPSSRPCLLCLFYSHSIFYHESYMFLHTHDNLNSPFLDDCWFVFFFPSLLLLQVMIQWITWYIVLNVRSFIHKWDWGHLPGCRFVHFWVCPCSKLSSVSSVCCAFTCSSLQALFFLGTRIPAVTSGVTVLSFPLSTFSTLKMWWA